MYFHMHLFMYIYIPTNLAYMPNLKIIRLDACCQNKYLLKIKWRDEYGVSFARG